MSQEQPATAPLVPGYAGHGDAVARRLSDQQVRATVGELLAELEDRVPAGPLRERLDASILRCEFGDQQVIRAIENDRFGEPDMAALVEELDRKVIAAARALWDAVADELACIEALERAFDERAAAIAAALKPQR